jgi:uncharacterized protein
MNYSLQEIETLHKKYAPSDLVFDVVFVHCQIVKDIAEQLIAKSGLSVDADLVRTGCLLHDIGVYPLFDADNHKLAGRAYLTHGIEGESILKAEGMPRELWHIASHHTGVGLTADDISNGNLPLPVKDYFAETIEEELIMYADKFHSKTTPPYFNSFEWYKQDIAQFGEDKVRKFEAMAEKFGLPDLDILSEKYGFMIR